MRNFKKFEFLITGLPYINLFLGNIGPFSFSHLGVIKSENGDSSSSNTLKTLWKQL